MNEQNNGIVVIDGSMRALPILRAYANSSSVFWVKSQFPCKKIYFNIGKSDKSGWIGTAMGVFYNEHNMFKVYVSGVNYTTPCQTAYRIVMIDNNGCRSVCGEGILRVGKTMISGVNDVVRENLLKYPDGLWRKVLISTDSSGSPTYEVLSEGIELKDIVGRSEVLYAYDSAKSKFFAVSGVVDEEGSYTVELEETASTYAKEDFILDTTTGFYRLMTAEEDETQNETLSMGEPIVD